MRLRRRNIWGCGQGVVLQRKAAWLEQNPRQKHEAFEFRMNRRGVGQTGLALFEARLGADERNATLASKEKIVHGLNQTLIFPPNRIKTNHLLTSPTTGQTPNTQHLARILKPRCNAMSTTAQVLANRENSKQSTGPRTPEGKAVSSANARTHGFSAADPVLPTEDRNQFNQLLDQNKSEWKPETAHQEFLVNQMTGVQWKLDRLVRMEVDMLAALDDPTKAFTEKDTAAGFTRLERYRAALERTYHRCIRELRASSKMQNEANSTEMAVKKYNKLIEHMVQHGLDTFLYEPTVEDMDRILANKAANDNS